MEGVTTPLAQAVADIEAHAAAAGWDAPARLFALVRTSELLAAEPGLAERMGLDPGAPDALTPVEQEELAADRPLDEVLAGIAWPPEVAGCALVNEVLVLPPAVEDEAPDGGDSEAAAEWAASHPMRREVRMVVAVLRDGSRESLLRVRAIDGTDDDIVGGADLVPGLADALAATLVD
jgi:hypothetical protein